MKQTWNLKDKKWLYWTGVVGFVLNFQLYLWLIAVILYFTCDRGEPKTKDYQIKRVFEKFMIIVGNLGLIGIIVFGLYIALFGAGTFFW
jgi:hypothetical protein